MVYNEMMNLGTKNANDLISKDFKTAELAAKKVINDKDVETFKKLCEKSDFLFDFIKQKISDNLFKAVDSSNYKNLTAFMHTYCADFEDFIVNALVKFASEDLTDELLELFENGDEQQKAYCAAYFCSIKDSLCLEFLNKYALSDFDPLARNCARALRGFGDKTLFNEMLARIQGEGEDFEKYEALNFLAAYGDADIVPELIKYMRGSAFSQNAAALILTLKPLQKLVEDGQVQEALELFDNILGAYPEVLPIETITDYGIYDFIKYLVSMPRSSYVSRLILKTMIKSDLISQNDIYTFDADKKTKELVGEIQNYLKSLNDEDYKTCLEEELGQDESRVQEALDVIYDLYLKDYAPSVAKLVQDSKTSPLLISAGVKTLKGLDALNLVNKDEVTKNIQEENILALINSYFN